MIAAVVCLGVAGYPAKATSQRLAPIAVTQPVLQLGRASVPATRVLESSSHGRLLISAAVGAVVGGAIGAYQAQSEESHTACAGTLTTTCSGTNNYLRYISAGVIVGGLVGALIGNNLWWN